MEVKIKHINTVGLDEKTREILKKDCYFVAKYKQDNTLFYEIKNINGEIARIFPERIFF
tara:strand:- start:612 stop:788 length:177 start_codon:yes stop_codon:yes gene_type:complete